MSIQLCYSLSRLEVYRRLSPLRVLIAGGDGSVGWVLGEIDSLHLKVIYQVASLSRIVWGPVKDRSRTTAGLAKGEHGRVVTKFFFWT